VALYLPCRLYKEIRGKKGGQTGWPLDGAQRRMAYIQKEKRMGRSQVQSDRREEKEGRSCIREKNAPCNPQEWTKNGG